MARTTKTVGSFWMIWDNLHEKWVGKPGKYARSNQPAVYWSEGHARSAVPIDSKLDDGTPHYQLVEKALWGTVEI